MNYSKRPPNALRYAFSHGHGNDHTWTTALCYCKKWYVAITFDEVKVCQTRSCGLLECDEQERTQSNTVTEDTRGVSCH